MNNFESLCELLYYFNSILAYFLIYSKLHGMILLFTERICYLKLRKLFKKFLRKLFSL